MLKIFKHEDENFGKTKLDSVLTHISLCLRDTLVTIGIIAFAYWLIYLINEYTSQWVWNTFIK